MKLGKIGSVESKDKSDKRDRGGSTKSMVQNPQRGACLVVMFVTIKPIMAKEDFSSILRLGLAHGLVASIRTESPTRIYNIGEVVRRVAILRIFSVVLIEPWPAKTKSPRKHACKPKTQASPAS